MSQSNFNENDLLSKAPFNNKVKAFIDRTDAFLEHPNTESELPDFVREHLYHHLIYFSGMWRVYDTPEYQHEEVILKQLLELEDLLIEVCDEFGIDRSIIQS